MPSVDDVFFSFLRNVPFYYWPIRNMRAPLIFSLSTAKYQDRYHKTNLDETRAFVTMPKSVETETVCSFFVNTLLKIIWCKLEYALQLANQEIHVHTPQEN